MRFDYALQHLYKDTNVAFTPGKPPDKHIIFIYLLATALWVHKKIPV